METSSEFWKRKTFVIITGASRGIGRTLAEKIAGLVNPGSLLLLISRDESSLESLRAHIKAHHPEIHVKIGLMDLSSCSESIVASTLSNSLTELELKADDFSHSICIHNAGSLGDASKRCADLDVMDSCVTYFRLNLASVIILNSIFLKTFSYVQKTIVNITSLCGVQPFPSLALYCTGKAARDMFFQVLAKEEPSIRVLNYAPGPVETNMLNQLRVETWNPEMKDNTSGALTPETTCYRLIQLLAENKYPSGAHVDYFDPPFE